MTDHDDGASRPRLRRGTAADIEPCHTLLWETVTDLGRRQATPLEGTAEEWWQTSEPFQRFLADHAAEWWVAEAPESGQLIGYARSIERGGLFELTEFFVQPGSQSQGLGRALLERAFPLGRGEVRSIIATGSPSALGRYYRADTVARFPILSLARVPEAVDPGARLTPQALPRGADSVATIALIERSVLEFERTGAEAMLLLEHREAYGYLRGDEVAGYAFVGAGGAGPIAALDPDDLPDILLHVEARAAALGVERLELEVPSPNAVAVRHLLARGFRIDPWINYLMSSRPFGQFDRFIGFSPPLFL
jgi:GNAT superfamily N-acetyltransferase